MNPFESPGFDGEGPSTGRIDIGAAIRTAASVALAQWTHLIAVWLILGLVYIVSVCSCVLWIATGPWMLWGTSRWVLSALDGKRDLSPLWTSVRDDPFTAWARGWGYMLLLVLVMVPILPPSIYVGLQFQGLDPMTATAYQGGIMAMAAAYGAITIRFQQSVWSIAERRHTVMDAVSTTWRETAESWAPLAALAVGWTLILSPIQLANTYASTYFSSLPLGQMMDAMPAFYAITFAVSALNTMGALLYFMILGAAYRQLHPKPPEEPV